MFKDTTLAKMNKLSMRRRRPLAVAVVAVLLVYLLASLYISLTAPKVHPSSRQMHTELNIADKIIDDGKLCQTHDSEGKLHTSCPGVNLVTYQLALRAHSSESGWITLALADSGCLDMAINFYETALKPYNIKHYLIIGSDRKTCQVLVERDINCYVYVEDQSAAEASLYHSKDFLRKMNIRTFMILDALNLGFNVHHTDLDIYFMKNPYQEFHYQSRSYDLAPLWDARDDNLNAGFIFIHASKPSIAVYAASCYIAKTEPETDDQRALNRAIQLVNATGHLRLNVLPKNQYLSGKAYWGVEGERNFPEQYACAECVVVHNNWIISMEAKRYRFREIGMWHTDWGQYYSDPERKYLTFDNEVVLDNATRENLNALTNALVIGELLNRTVILPRFHCDKFRCTILNFIKIAYFEKNFPNYRENSFLSHPLVPQSVKDSKSNILAIDTETLSDISRLDLRITRQEMEVFTPRDHRRGASTNEIKAWFGARKESVLQFDNLYKAFCCIKDMSAELRIRLREGFIPPKKYTQH